MEKSQLLVSEKMPWMVMLFGYLSVVPLIALALFGWKSIDAAQGLLSGEDRMQTTCIPLDPPLCTTFEAFPPLLPNVAWTIVSLAAAIACWATAFRYRAVWQDGDGTIRIAWGERALPITLKRFHGSECRDVTVTLERRFSVSPIVGTSVVRTRRAPDRWRMRGTVGGRIVNLGSYETEARAQEVARLFAETAR